MKFGQLLIGLLVGGLLSFALTKYFTKNCQQPDNSKTTAADSTSTEKWAWPENLDALKAAPDNHKVVFEDDNVRVLAVILDGKI